MDYLHIKIETLKFVCRRQTNKNNSERLILPESEVFRYIYIYTYHVYIIQYKIHDIIMSYLMKEKHKYQLFKLENKH